MTRHKPDNAEILSWLIRRCDVNNSNINVATVTLAQTGVDSLEIVSISMELEDEFSLRIDLENLSADTTLSQIVQRLIPID